VIRFLWLMLRGVLSVAAVCLTFLDGLSWVVLPGRFVLDALGAHGPDAGRYAVVISGVFYAAAALVAAVLRRDDEPHGAALELAG
jgi:hypothetical protein